MNETIVDKKQRLIEQRTRVKTLAELLIDDTSTYIMAMNDNNCYNPLAGCGMLDKNSNATKTALKAQITLLRNELLKLSKELK